MSCVVIKMKICSFSGVELMSAANKNEGDLRCVPAALNRTGRGTYFLESRCLIVLVVASSPVAAHRLFNYPSRLNPALKISSLMCDLIPK